MAIHILNEIEHPTSRESLLQALKALKNDVIGHSHRKESWVRRGIVKHLKGILERRRAASKQRQDLHRSYSDVEEALQLQTITIVGSLAHGGPAFVTPLRLAQIYSPLLVALSSAESSGKVVLASLRCLNAIADAVALENTESNVERGEFHRAIFADSSLANLNRILSKDSPSSVGLQQQAFAEELIAKTVASESERRQIISNGVLTTLALRLSSFVLATQQSSGQRPTESATLGITPASEKARLAPLLQAICSVIGDSKTRMHEFCYYSIWARVFPDSERKLHPWDVQASHELTEETNRRISALPHNHDNDVLPVISHKTNQPIDQKVASASRELTAGKGLEGFTARHEDDTPLVAWLIDSVKTQDGLTRLMAMNFVGLLFRSGMISLQRRRSLSMLIVPVLVDMLGNMLDNHPDQMANEGTSLPPLAKSAQRLMKEIVPRVLALFVYNNEILQKGASEGGAIKKLSQLLKRSFDPIPASLLMSTWNANDREELSIEMEPDDPSILGQQGIQPLVHHTLQVRESFLTALSAMATLADANRTAIIDYGVVPFVIESLKVSPVPKEKSDQADTVKPGNSASTLIAACGCARTLSRSVSVLRTSLVDAGLAKPIFSLLRHPDVDVQIAATSAIANIVMPFSAMRQELTEAGLVNVLCEHAHSSDTKLRISALWALGHLVIESPNDLKVNVVRGLSPGWLKHVICTGAGEDFSCQASHNDSGFGLSAANASGEHIDILNSMNEGSQGYHTPEGISGDVQMSDSTMSFESPATVSNGGVSLNVRHGNRPTERTTTSQAVAADDLAVQEQGLNLLRNLLVGPDFGEMVDYLFAELGQDELFDTLTDLLRPKSVDNLQDGAKLTPPPTEIVLGVVYVLVHIAASSPRHKQIVLAQTSLLRLLMPLFQHPHPHVRVALIWMVINLAWKEDGSDKVGAASRAYELKKLGITTKIHAAAADSDTDVRERAKQAIVQLTDLMKE